MIKKIFSILFFSILFFSLIHMKGDLVFSYGCENNDECPADMMCKQHNCQYPRHCLPGEIAIGDGCVKDSNDRCSDVGDCDQLVCGESRTKFCEGVCMCRPTLQPPNPPISQPPNPPISQPPNPPCIPCKETCSQCQPGLPCDCVSCPKTQNLNCTGCEAKCGQTCPGQCSCQMPSCPGTGCRNTSVTVCKPTLMTDRGSAAKISDVKIITKKKEKSNKQSIVNVSFSLGINSDITDYCTIELLKSDWVFGSNILPNGNDITSIFYSSGKVVQSFKKIIAPACAPAKVTSFVSHDFTVDYNTKSAGVYRARVVCVNDTCK